MAAGGPDWLGLAVKRFAVTGLKNKGDYKFRVKAVNKAGPGDPSNTTDPVTCKPRRRKMLV